MIFEGMKFDVMKMSSNVIAAYRKAFPENAIMTSTDDAVERISDLLNSIEGLKKITQEEKLLLLKQGFTLAMVKQF
ncbi:unnamed protein product [Gongylonema pulchrum]|uniref:Transcriptional regulator n=1 Tax=Gongylonema pulchrum TaxID=637853 RepID=A0A183DBA1_9BILA|nr:unnamed protein product [Gongylonema pulchrum]